MMKSYSASDWIFQFVTIVGGVLIALMFDGLADWSRERSLVREARAGIEREIADNRTELEKSLAGADARNGRLDTALRFADELLARQKTDVHEVNLGVSVAELSDASWATADRTGALALMDYDEVQSLARLYRLQDLYNTRLRGAMERLASALTLFVAAKNPEQAARPDLEAFRLHIITLQAELYLHDEFAQQLLKLYKETRPGPR